MNTFVRQKTDREVKTQRKCKKAKNTPTGNSTDS